MGRLADDIEHKIIKDYPEVEIDEIRKLLLDYVSIGLNVGSSQFVRSILLIADGDKAKMIKELKNCLDPRDVVSEGEILSGSNNHWMMIPFEEIEILDDILYQVKDLEVNNSSNYWDFVEDEHSNLNHL